MKVLVIGSIDEQKQQKAEEQRRFQLACEAIGKELAQAGHEIVVGQEASDKAGMYVIQGAAAANLAAGIKTRVWLLKPGDSTSVQIATDRGASNIEFLVKRIPVANYEASRYFMADFVDAVIAISGSSGTAACGQIAAALGKVVLGLPGLGGSGKELWDQTSTNRANAGELENQYSALEVEWPTFADADTEDKKNAAKEATAKLSKVVVELIEGLAKFGAFKSDKSGSVVFQYTILTWVILLLLSWAILFSLNSSRFQELAKQQNLSDSNSSGATPAKNVNNVRPNPSTKNVAENKKESADEKSKEAQPNLTSNGQADKADGTGKTEPNSETKSKLDDASKLKPADPKENANKTQDPPSTREEPDASPPGGPSMLSSFSISPQSSIWLFLMAYIATGLGVFLRHSLRNVFDSTAHTALLRIFTDAASGLILTFIVCLLYIVGAVAFTGTSEQALSPERLNDFQRTAITLSLVGVTCGFLVEQTAESLRTVLLDRFTKFKVR